MAKWAWVLLLFGHPKLAQRLSFQKSKWAPFVLLGFCCWNVFEGQPEYPPSLTIQATKREAVQYNSGFLRKSVLI